MMFLNFKTTSFMPSQKPSAEVSKSKASAGGSPGNSESEENANADSKDESASFAVRKSATTDNEPARSTQPVVQFRQFSFQRFSASQTSWTPSSFSQSTTPVLKSPSSSSTTSTIMRGTATTPKNAIRKAADALEGTKEFQTQRTSPIFENEDEPSDPISSLSEAFKVSGLVWVIRKQA